MTHRTSTMTILVLIFLPTLLHAQPVKPEGFTAFEETRLPGRHHRLEVAADYLQLTAGQRAEWEAILETHKQMVAHGWQEVESLHREFGQLAATEDPDLSELGRLALTIHRRSETLRTSRSELTEELASILVPEQLEKFDALQVARETIRPRDRDGRPHRRSRADSGDGGG